MCVGEYPPIDFDENQEVVSGKERTTWVQLPPSQLRPQKLFFFIKKKGLCNDMKQTYVFRGLFNGAT